MSAVLLLWWGLASRMPRQFAGGLGSWIKVARVLDLSQARYPRVTGAILPCLSRLFLDCSSIVARFLVGFSRFGVPSGSSSPSPSRCPGTPACFRRPTLGRGLKPGSLCRRGRKLEVAQGG